MLNTDAACAKYTEALNEVYNSDWVKQEELHNKVHRERDTDTHRDTETYRLTEALNEVYDSDCIRQEELCNQVHRQKERDTQRQ